MNPHLENYNYWNDSRTIAGMVEKEKIEETPEGNFLIFEEWQEDDSTITHKLRCKWGICDTCGGDGWHNDANIDCCGITGEDMARLDYEEGYDEEGMTFRHHYAAGRYRVNCRECGGRRVVPVLDESNNDKELVAKYQKHRVDLYNDARESASERAMGA